MAPRVQRHWAQWVWLAAGLAVVLRVVAIFWGTEDPAIPGKVASSRPPITVVAGRDTATGALLAEQVALFDQQPLSMPTQWNAGVQELPSALRRQPGQVFGLFTPQLVFPPEKLEPVFSPRGGAPEDSLGGLRTIGAMTGGWLSLGRVDRPVTKLPLRDAAVEVVRLAEGGGLPVLTQALQGLPADVVTHDWAPIEFSVVVSAAGLVGVPTLAGGSGVESVDAFFGRFLVRDFRLGERLLPGLYRVRIVR